MEIYIKVISHNVYYSSQEDLKHYISKSISPIVSKNCPGTIENIICEDAHILVKQYIITF